MTARLLYAAVPEGVDAGKDDPEPRPPGTSLPKPAQSEDDGPLVFLDCLKLTSLRGVSEWYLNSTYSETEPDRDREGENYDDVGEQSQDHHQASILLSNKGTLIERGLIIGLSTSEGSSKVFNGC